MKHLTCLSVVLIASGCAGSQSHQDRSTTAPGAQGGASRLEMAKALWEMTQLEPTDARGRADALALRGS